jgi:DNA helicase HerA-like ATPase
MNNILSYLSGLHADVMTPKQRSTHIHIAGKPGTGKSRMIESMVIQDVNAGHGVGFIDPHGDLFRNLLFRLATKEEVWDRVVIIDPLDPEWTIGFNPLAKNYNLTEERQALYLTDVGMKIWGISPTSAPRMVWLMSNSFLALSSLGLTLLDLPRFLMDVEYRERLVPRIGNQQAKQFFMHEFPKSERAIHQWVTPVLNKIGGLIFDPELRLIFSSPTTLNMRRVIDEQLILLVNLPKGILGEGASALTAAFIVALLQKAALSRTDVHVRKPFYLYLDEFQNYTTDNIKDILAESRKYALSLILAHQYLDQLSSDLQSAVLNTSGTLISFQVGYHDALKLAKEISET